MHIYIYIYIYIYICIYILYIYVTQKAGSKSLVFCQQIQGQSEEFPRIFQNILRTDNHYKI